MVSVLVGSAAMFIVLIVVLIRIHNGVIIKMNGRIKRLEEEL